MASSPTGTVTFLFTDIEGSTLLAQEHPDSLLALLERHHAILKSAIEAHGGYTFQIIGDAFCAAFQTAQQALSAAINAQKLLGAETWSPAPIRVRMGISTGSAQIPLQDGRPPDYSSYMNMARVQRIMSLAQGGQILISTASAELLRAERQSNINFRDMGEQRLRGFPNLERLWQVIAPGLQVEFRPLSSVNASPNNLPLQLTSFVGRQHEIADVHRLIHQHRLVTLTGSGGTGKTRLALEAAPDLLDQFPDGIWLVELAPILDGGLVPQTILHLLGLPLESVRQPLEILTDYLAGKSLLILMDNCEHLLTECSVFVEAILQSAPAVKVLATSREALNVIGEQTYRVPSLPSPDVNHLPSLLQLTQFEAVHLFIERAMLVSPGFTVTSENAAALAQICHHLDGIPLAIELAAARVKSVPLEAIVARLDDRFRLLTGGSRTALPRQQTLRAMIDWSYALLSEPEKSLLQRLCVFRGGRTLEAAEAVCAGEGVEQADILDLLSKLIDKSLLTLDEHGRYRMLETVRLYVRERLQELGEEPRLRDRHLKFFMEWAEEVEPKLRGAEQIAWWDQMEMEHNNIRAALEWSLTGGDAQMGLRLAGAAFWYWKARSYWMEGLKWLKDCLSKTPTPLRTVARAKALVVAGSMATQMYTADPIRAWLEDGLEILREVGDRWWISFALLSTGWHHLAVNEATAARDLFEESVSCARTAQDEWILGLALWSLGAALERVDYEAARPILEECVLHARAAGDRWALASALKQLGTVALDQGDFARTVSLGEESLSLFREIGDKGMEAEGLTSPAEALLGQGEVQRARKLLEESVTLAERVGLKGVIAVDLTGLGCVAEMEGQPRRSAMLLAAGESLLNSLGTTVATWPWAYGAYEKCMAKVKAQLSETEFGHALAAGQAMRLEQAVKFALENMKAG